MKEVSNTTGVDSSLAKMVGHDIGLNKQSSVVGADHIARRRYRSDQDRPIDWRAGVGGDAALGIGRKRSNQSDRQLIRQMLELMKKLFEGLAGNGGANPAPGGTTPIPGGNSTDPGSETGGTTDPTNGTGALTHLKTDKDAKGNPTIKTDDGYTLNFEGVQQAWTITGPDGKTTRIWGDPHVNESDGDAWDFKDQSTFVFGNNKLTIETTPYGNGETLTKSVHLYNGGERVSITDIDKDKPRLESQAKDGKSHDAKLKDGDQYMRGQDPRTGGEGWIKVALNSIVKVFQPVFDLFSGGGKKTEDVQQDDIFKALS